MQTAKIEVAGFAKNVRGRLGNIAGGFGRAAAGVTGFIGKLGPLGAAVGVAAGTLLTLGGAIGAVNSQFAAIDKLAKTADKLGESTQLLAGFGFAAGQTGVGADQANVALQRMTRRIAEAAQGSGEAKTAIAELGLSARDLAELSPVQAFAKLADAFKNVKSPSDRLRLAFKLFDSEGVALVNTLKLGSSGLADMQKEAERLGIVLDRDAAAKVEAANDAIDKMKQAGRGLAIELAVAVAPAVVSVANALTRLVQWLNRTIQAVKSFFGAAKALEKTGDSTRKLTTAIKDIPIDVEAAKAELEALSKKTEKVTKVTDEWAKVGESLNERFKTPLQRMKDEVAQLQGAVLRGKIGWDVYRRGISQVVAEFEAATDAGGRLAGVSTPKNVGAAVRGTSAGFSATITGVNALQAMARAESERKRRDARRDKLLADISKELIALRREGVVKITKTTTRL